MAELSTYHEPSEFPVPSWLESIRSKIKNISILRNTFSWLDQLDSLSAKIIRYKEGRQEGYFTFSFFEPYTHDGIFCSLDLDESESVVVSEIRRNSEAHKILGDRATQVSDAIKNSFTAEVTPEIVLDTEERKKLTFLSSSATVEVDSESGELKHFSMYTMRNGYIRIKKDKINAVLPKKNEPISLHERQLIQITQQPDIFTDIEPYQDVLVNKYSVKDIELWVEGDAEQPLMLAVRAFAIYDHDTSKLQKVIVISEAATTRWIEEDHSGTREIFEFRPENATPDNEWELEEVSSFGDVDARVSTRISSLKFQAGGVVFDAQLPKLHPLIPNSIRFDFPQVLSGLPAQVSHAEPLVFSDHSQF